MKKILPGLLIGLTLTLTGCKPQVIGALLKGAAKKPPPPVVNNVAKPGVANAGKQEGNQLARAQGNGGFVAVGNPAPVKQEETPTPKDLQRGWSSDC